MTHVDCRFRDKQRVVFLPRRWDQVHSVGLLLEADCDCDCDSRDADGNTALLLSIKHACLDSYLQLYSQRQAFRARGTSGPSAPPPGTLNLSAVNKLGQTALHLLVGKSRFDVDASLGGLGLEDCQREDSNGRSPFHYSLMEPEGKTWCRQMLLKYGSSLMDRKVGVANRVD